MTNLKIAWTDEAKKSFWNAYGFPQPGESEAALNAALDAALAEMVRSGDAGKGFICGNEYAWTAGSRAPIGEDEFPVLIIRVEPDNDKT